MDRIAWSLVAAINILGVGHHFDHSFRHHLVGWPFTNHFTGYTVALMFYPVVLIGIYLTRRGVIGPGSWSILAGIAFVFMLGSHFGPIAEDPVGGYFAEYGSHLKSNLALLQVLLFLLSAVTATAYAGRLWAVQRARSLTPSIAH